MAGIGWKLQRMMDRGSLAGTMAAYLTGVAVTSAPWLLTTAVLMSLRVIARQDHSAAFALLERTITLIYALTVILSAPVHVVVSRYTADRLYDRQVDRIAAPLWWALTLTVAGGLLVGMALMLCLRAPLSLAVPGVLLTVVVGAQWLLLSVGGGLVSPLVVLRAFCAGAPMGLLASLWLYQGAHLGPAGYLCGFGVGQLVTLVILLHGVAGAVPGAADETARLLPAFAGYWLLAVSSFVYYLSIWADKALVWLLDGGAAASSYSAVAAVAWFSVVPAFGWIYVQIETVFYGRFRAFYRDVGGGAPLSVLREEAALIGQEARRILGGAALVQAAALGLALLGAPALMRLAAMPAAAAFSFRLAVVGASLQLLGLLEMLLLHYFDLRQEALSVASVLLLGEVGFVLAAHAAGISPAAGYAAACALGAAVGLALVRARLRTLLADTFQGQPFGDSV